MEHTPASRFAAADWQLAELSDRRHGWPLMARMLNKETNGAFSTFRKSLTPHYAKVWRDIAAGYLALGALLAMAGYARSGPAMVAIALILAPGIGFAIAYIQLFLHEAAHWNLAPERVRSDRLADWLIAWQVGTNVKEYRKLHFTHHRCLGTAQDPENSYYRALTPRMLVEMVSGVHLVRIFMARMKARASAPVAAQSTALSASEPAGSGKGLIPLFRGLACHGILLSVLAWFSAWGAMIAWCMGMLIFFPLFATLRPILEHRPAKQSPSQTEAASPLWENGDAVTRLFDDGWLARLFGGAGFNRHLLHHWEPQISYTRLKDLEDYLNKTNFKTILDQNRSTYRQSLNDIMRSDKITPKEISIISDIRK